MRIRPDIRAGKAGQSILLEAQRGVGVIENQIPEQDHSYRRQKMGKELEKHIYNNSIKLTSTLNQHSLSTRSFEKQLLRAEVNSSCLSL